MFSSIFSHSIVSTHVCIFHYKAENIHTQTDREKGMGKEKKPSIFFDRMKDFELYFHGETFTFESDKENIRRQKCKNQNCCNVLKRH